MTRDLDRELKQLRSAVHARVRHLQRVRTHRVDEPGDNEWVPTKPPGLLSWFWDWTKPKS